MERIQKEAIKFERTQIHFSTTFLLPSSSRCLGFLVLLLQLLFLLEQQNFPLAPAISPPQLKSRQPILTKRFLSYLPFYFVDFSKQGFLFEGFQLPSSSLAKVLLYVLSSTDICYDSSFSETGRQARFLLEPTNKIITHDCN